MTDAVLPPVPRERHEAVVAKLRRARAAMTAVKESLEAVMPWSGDRQAIGAARKTLESALEETE